MLRPHDAMLVAALLMAACLPLWGDVGLAAAKSLERSCGNVCTGLQLTKELHAKGRTSYVDAACIPDNAFAGHSGDVTIEGLPFLTSIGKSSFRDFTGKLAITGNHPKLATIKWSAFESAFTSSSAVIFAQGLPSLRTICGRFFFDEKGADRGTFTFGGECPVLEQCARVRRRGSSSAHVGPPGSVMLTKELHAEGRPTYLEATCIPAHEFERHKGDVTISGLPFLETVSPHAFWWFKGKLTFTGEDPALQDVQHRAFDDVQSTSSTVQFAKGLPKLTAIEASAFLRFNGRFSFGGEHPLMLTCFTNAEPRISVCGGTCGGGSMVANMAERSQTNHCASCDEAWHMETRTNTCKPHTQCKPGQCLAKASNHTSGVVLARARAWPLQHMPWRVRVHRRSRAQFPRAIVGIRRTGTVPTAKFARCNEFVMSVCSHPLN